MPQSTSESEASNSSPPQQPNELPDSTIVVFVRHGKTPTTGEILPGRTPGLHLSEVGLNEAREAAVRLSEAYPSPTAIYSSPLERARETAQPYCDAVGVEAIIDTGLLECDFGEWTGEKLKELAQLPSWKTVQSAPSRFRFPGGESFAEMSGRMIRFLSQVTTEHRGGVVVCFSHADPIKAVIADVMGLHLDQFQRIQVNTASISVIAQEGDQPHVVSLNNTPQLPRKAF